jgi:hypothetical protein
MMPAETQGALAIGWFGNSATTASLWMSTAFGSSNFVKRLTAEVQSCDVLLAVIGPNWLDARDEDGNRRLDNPHDFVRIEISAALQRDIPVIPFLLNGTKIPRADRLPPELQELTLRSALDVRLGSFHSDVARLIAALKQSPSTEPTSDQETYPKLEEFVWARKANPVKKVQAETWLQIILFGIAGALVASWLLPMLGISLGVRSSGFFNATLGDWTRDLLADKTGLNRRLCRECGADHSFPYAIPYAILHEPPVAAARWLRRNRRKR